MAQDLIAAANSASAVRSLCCGADGDRAAALAGRRTRFGWFKAEPPVLRSPAGVFQDNRNYWDAGKPYYDPERIKIPTLVIVAEWDQLTPSQGAQALFHKLPTEQAARRDR